MNLLALARYCILTILNRIRWRYEFYASNTASSACFKSAIRSCDHQNKKTS